MLSHSTTTSPSPFPSIPSLRKEALKSASSVIKINGRSFELKYDVRIAREGVVSLSNTALYPSVVCHPGGVEIGHGLPLQSKSLEELYPSGALVFIPNWRVPNCRLSPSMRYADLSKEILNEQLKQFHHSYLRIFSVSATRSGAMIFGAEATYFSVVQQADISLQPLSASSVSDADPLLRSPVPKTSLLYGNLSAGLMQAASNGLMRHSVDLVSLSVSWTEDVVSMNLKLIPDWRASLRMDTIIGNGTKNGTDSTNLLAAIVDIIPPITFFDEIPPFKIGLAIEVPLVGESKSVLGAVVSAGIIADYTSPRSEISLHVEGSYDRMAARYSARRVVIPGMKVGKAEFDVTVQDFDDPYGLTIASELSLSPTFSIFMPTLTARVSTKLSLRLDGDSISWTEDRALPPIEGGNGVCLKCHRHALTATGTLSNTSIVAVLGGKEGVNIFGDLGYSTKVSKLVADFSYNDNDAGTFEVGSSCFSPAFGEFVQVCENTCCAPKFHSCEECFAEVPAIVEVRKFFL